MAKIGFEGGGPCDSAGAKPMEYVVEMNCRRRVEIRYPRHSLP